MAYDLVLRRQTGRSYARGSSVPLNRSDRLPLLLAAALLAVPAASRVSRLVEVVRYRRGYSHDLYRGRRYPLTRTQEVPVTRMRDLVYGEDGR